MAEMTPQDWKACGDRLRTKFRFRVRFEDPTLIEDLTQEALVRILRASRATQIENIEAFENTVASRVWTDHVRRRSTWNRVFAAVDEVPEMVAPEEVPAGPDQGNPLARFQFLVLEFFQSRSGGCIPLIQEYVRLERPSWKLVAENLGQSYPAVRKRWERCRAALLEAAEGSVLSELAAVFAEVFA